MRKTGPQIPYIMLVVLALACAGLLLYIVPYRYHLNNTVTFTETDDRLDNPLTGYAPPAENAEECRDSKLVYIGITWAMWEPAEGEYDIEAVEELFNVERWKNENKHAVLRFICDEPGEEEHMDIPRWLYERTRDGEFYDTSYGTGYSPDYENGYFRERHSLAVQALAEYCNQDDFVAYIELGSLGHWGEWHTNTDEGLKPLPDAQTCWEYVLDYSDNFHNARLLMRRNYVMASDGNMGLYNDMTGSKDDTEEWLGWIRDGGSFETAGEALDYVPMEGFWQTAPCGGEFTSQYMMEEMLSDRFSDTLNMIRDTHMTFIGPQCPEGEMKDASPAWAIREELGYRYYISAMNTQYSFSDGELKVGMTWENAGIAPLYWDWPVTMYVYDLNGDVKYWETVDISLSELLPGGTVQTECSIPFTDEIRRGYQIGIGITDPDEKEYISLAMETERKGNVQIIYAYEG